MRESWVKYQGEVDLIDTSDHCDKQCNETFRTIAGLNYSFQDLESEGSDHIVRNKNRTNLNARSMGFYIIFIKLRHTVYALTMGKGIINYTQHLSF